MCAKIQQYCNLANGKASLYSALLHVFCLPLKQKTICSFCESWSAFWSTWQTVCYWNSLIIMSNLPAKHWNGSLRNKQTFSQSDLKYLISINLFSQRRKNWLLANIGPVKVWLKISVKTLEWACTLKNKLQIFLSTTYKC